MYAVTVTSLFPVYTPDSKKQFSSLSCEVFSFLLSYLIFPIFSCCFPFYCLGRILLSIKFLICIFMLYSGNVSVVSVEWLLITHRDLHHTAGRPSGSTKMKQAKNIPHFFDINSKVALKFIVPYHPHRDIILSLHSLFEKLIVAHLVTVRVLLLYLQT